MTMTNIGLIYFEEGRLKEASAYYEKARLLFEKIQNTRGFALLENYLGDFYLKQKNREKAEEHYVRALGMYEQLGNKFGASLSLYNLGLLHQEKTDWKTAMDFAQKSLRYAKEIGVADQIYHSEQLVSELYAELGNPSEALHHYKKYIFWRDSLTNQETTRKIAQAEMHFEYQKKEALLDEQNKRQTQFLWFCSGCHPRGRFDPFVL